MNALNQIRSSAMVVTIIIIVVLIILGGGVWYFIIKKPPQQKRPPVTEDEFNDWKTYRNEEQGFEFKYPRDWQEAETSTPYPVMYHTYFLTKSDFDSCFDIKIMGWFYKNNKEERDLNVWFEEEKNSRKKEKGYEGLTIAGQEAIKYIYDPTSQSPGNIFYEFVKDGKGYIFTILYGTQSDGIGEKIISTFKFLE